MHVVPNQNGGWDIKTGGAEKAYRHFERKTDAVDCGRDISRNQRGELYIHGQDGRIQEKDSYGSDPYPPRG